jgi:hypothetical protein
MRGIGFALVLVLLSGAAQAKEDCSDPLVKKPEDAGRIAFAMWHVANPNFTATDERKWLSSFTITLHDCVWHLAAKPEQGEDPTYSHFIIGIGAKDGRFLGAEVID